MTRNLSWNDPEGIQAVKDVVAKRIPTWKDGLWPFQEQLIIHILNGEDVLLCTATGDGKLALFTVPILCHLEISNFPEAYPNLPVKSRPVGLIVTPTKGLASNIVTQLSEYRIVALSYCHETLTEARKSGRNLTKEIAACEMYQVICVDPEHILGSEWIKITDSDIFRDNLVYACVKETHLLDEWGSSFRPAFKHIGTFLRGELPSHVSIFALSATLQPGPSAVSTCRSLGFRDGSFHLIRRSNERPNIQFLMEPLEHGVSSDDFSQILCFVSCGRKAIIHCPTIELIYRVYLYLWRMEPPGVNHFRRVRMYHSLNSDEYNDKTLDLLKDDPLLLVVIASVAFANGINVTTLLDSISITFPKTLDQAWQQEGRVGRVLEDLCRGVMLVQRSNLSKAEKFFSEQPHSIEPNSKRKLKSAVTTMDLAKALLLVEKICYIAAINHIYQNPNLEETTLDCVQAKRPLPCSLCCSQYKISVSFLKPIDKSPFLQSPDNCSAPKVPKSQKLTKKERTLLEKELERFGDDLYKLLRYDVPYRPQSSYFPHGLITRLLDRILALITEDDLKELLISEDWAFRDSYGSRLHELVLSQQLSIKSGRGYERFGKHPNR